MNIASISQSQSFKGLNYDYMSTVDRERFLKGNMKQLNEIGKNYDINFISLYVNDPNASVVDIDVRPLKKGLNFIQRILRPIGRSCFESGYLTNIGETLHSKEDFIKAVYAAVADLGKKVCLHK